MCGLNVHVLSRALSSGQRSVISSWQTCSRLFQARWSQTEVPATPAKSSPSSPLIKTHSEAPTAKMHRGNYILQPDVDLSTLSPHERMARAVLLSSQFRKPAVEVRQHPNRRSGQLYDVMVTSKDREEIANTLKIIVERTDLFQYSAEQLKKMFYLSLEHQISPDMLGRWICTVLELQITKMHPFVLAQFAALLTSHGVMTASLCTRIAKMYMPNWEGLAPKTMVLFSQCFQVEKNSDKPWLHGKSAPLRTLTLAAERILHKFTAGEIVAFLHNLHNSNVLRWDFLNPALVRVVHHVGKFKDVECYQLFSILKEHKGEVQPEMTKMLVSSFLESDIWEIMPLAQRVTFLPNIISLDGNALDLCKDLVSSITTLDDWDKDGISALLQISAFTKDTKRRIYGLVESFVLDHADNFVPRELAAVLLKYASSLPAEYESRAGEFIGSLCEKLRTNVYSWKVTPCMVFAHALGQINMPSSSVEKFFTRMAFTLEDLKKTANITPSTLENFVLALTNLRMYEPRMLDFICTSLKEQLQFQASISYHLLYTFSFVVGFFGCKTPETVELVINSLPSLTRGTYSQDVLINVFFSLVVSGASLERVAEQFAIFVTTLKPSKIKNVSQQLRLHTALTYLVKNFPNVIKPDMVHPDLRSQLNTIFVLNAAKIMYIHRQRSGLSTFQVILASLLGAEYCTWSIVSDGGYFVDCAILVDESKKPVPWSEKYITEVNTSSMLSGQAAGAFSSEQQAAQSVLTDAVQEAGYTCLGIIFAPVAVTMFNRPNHTTGFVDFRMKMAREDGWNVVLISVQEWQELDTQKRQELIKSKFGDCLAFDTTEES